MHFKNGFSCMKVKLGFGIYEDIEVYKKYTKLLKKRYQTFCGYKSCYGRNEAIKLGLFLDKLDCVDGMRNQWFQRILTVT